MLEPSGKNGPFSGATRKAFSKEPADLAQLILNNGDSGSDAGLEWFVRHRFWRPFRYSIKASFWYGFAFTALTVLVIAAGLTSSVLAQAPGKTSDTLVGILGIVVAIGAAVNRLWRPGLRAVVRSRTANELRKEGWDFVRIRGRYSELGDGEQRLSAFVDQVQVINATAELVDETPVDDQSQEGQ